MSKYGVVVFPDESNAYEGERAFDELHKEGSLSLYGLAVVAKDADGKATVKDANYWSEQYGSQSVCKTTSGLKSDRLLAVPIKF